MKKRLLSWLLVIVMVLGMLPPQVLAAEEGVTVYAYYADTNGIVTGKNGTLLNNVPLTVTDKDSDGKITMDDAFITLHENYYEGGASGYTGGGWISQVWGVSTSNVCYVLNNKWVYSTMEPVSNGDSVALYIMSDTSAYSDLYTYFDEAEYTATAGETKAFTVNGYFVFGSGQDMNDTSIVYHANAVPEGATVTLTDESTKQVVSTTTVDATGKFNIAVPGTAGTYSILVNGKCTFTPTIGWYANQTYTNAPVVPALCTLKVEAPTVPVESVTLDQTAVELEVGGTAALTATVAPEDATDKTVAWTSSDENVAKVVDGVVTAVAAGSATITVASTTATDVKATCDVTVKTPIPEGYYEVTINVAPSTANVTFYTGSDTTTALTTEVTDNGVVNNYHQYILVVPKGTYTYRGVDGETNIGGMTFKVPFDEEIMSDGTASGEGLSLTLRRVNYYTTNKAITAVGDYTLRLVPGTLPDAVPGDQYIDSSNSRVYTPVMVMARGNALTYQQLITINGELAETYAVAPVTNVTFTAGTSANNKTFSLSSIVYHSVTAPQDAEVKAFLQINNFNVEEITDKTVSEPDADGMVTYTYKTPGGSNLSYRVSMDGKITRAGYFSSAAENVVVTFEESEDPTTTVNSLDNATIQKRMESSTMLNVNGQNDLSLGVDETFRLRAYRGAWQIVNSDTGNIMIEPDFHYNVISGGEHISIDVVDDVCTGNATGNWLDITGVSAGTAVIEVYYDAIKIGGGGTTYDGLYGATDPQRKSLFVIQVGAGEKTLQMTADGSSNIWDTEYDTVYFLGDTGSLTFTAALGGDAPDSVALSTNKGSTWTAVTAADGKYTVTGLIGGNNILRFTKGSVVEYQVVRAAKVTRTVTNLTRNEGTIAGDQLKVVYSGLYTPISKFSGIYNPGYGQGHKVTYTLPEGYTATTTGGQYDFISTNSYTLTIPEDAAGEVTLSGGHIAFNVMGVDDPLGGHRTLTDHGVGTNFSAVSTQHTRSVLPDITFTVEEMPNVAVTVTADVDGTAIVITDSTGAEVTADESGVYNLPLGTFSYTVTLDGYVTERGSFDVTLADAETGTKTISLTMRKVEGVVWDGTTTTEPSKDADGVYQIGTGAELAWFAANHGGANAVLTADISLGGFTWTPVTAYAGTFDGNGHWVTDLYINSTSANQGLFAQLSSNGVIKNLGVRGQVTSTGKNVGGIVGQLRNKGTVENCVSDVQVTGNRFTGGIVGNQYMSSTIKNSYNLGNVTGTNTSGNVGGISGGYTIATTAFTIENCYNLGTITASNSKNYGGLTYSTKAANGVNSYYVSGSADNGNSKVGTVKTAAELKTMASTLGDAYAADTNNINGGYPILTWQVVAEEPEVYDVTIPTGDGYTVTGEKTATEGESYSFTVTVADGYDAANMVVKVNGETVSAVEGKYTVDNVSGDLAITVEGVVEKPEIYDVTIPTGAGYTVTGEKTATEGESYTFTVEIAENYDATNMVVKVNGEIVSAVEGKYTVENVSGDLAITVEGVVEKPATEQVDVTIKGIHSAQISSAKLYTYTDGVKGDTDLLAGLETTYDSSAYNYYYTTSLMPGDYWIDGYDSNGDLNGGIKITVTADGENVFSIQRVYQIYATNSGWVLGTDYEISVKVTNQDRSVTREITLGTAKDYSGKSYTSCLFLAGDTVEATLTPIGERADTCVAATISKTSNINCYISGKISETLLLTFVAPAGSTISTGKFHTYYIYDFYEAVETKTLDDGRVSATYKVPKDSVNASSGPYFFYRVQNPKGVTYWDFYAPATYTETTATVEITAEQLFLESSEFNKNTVYHDYEKNTYDTADIYLNVNGQGYKNLSVGDTFELNVFRNWMAIENFYNRRVALPDMHYQIVTLEGDDVISIEPNANNSSVATLTAKSEGTAIVLVTYDAMYSNAAYVSGKAYQPGQFSAIWPENTGVFVVTVGKDGTAIDMGMTIDRLGTTGALDAEHDHLYYLGDAGASYSFKPEEDCIVTVNRSTVGDTMSFGTFTDSGVVTAEDGTVTVSGLTEGRHIIKVEKNGVANYQVITAKQTSYKLQKTVTDDAGTTTYVDMTDDEIAQISAGDTVYLQFSGLANPCEKLSGVYNHSAAINYVGEDGTSFLSARGGSFGVYDFGGNPARQLITITIPKYWTGDSYTLDGVISMNMSGSAPTSHRGVSYAKGVNANFSAATGVGGLLCDLPEITFQLAKTEFLTGTLNFADASGKEITADLTVTMTDADGNAVAVNEDNTFLCLAGQYNYVINGAGVQYATGTVTVTEDGDNKFDVTLIPTAEGAWDGVCAVEPAQDENGVYQIGTAAELAWFASAINGGQGSISGVLTADIDLANYPWTPIGNSSSSGKHLTGTFDGAGHTVSNLYINGTKGYMALFGYVGANGVVKNVTVKGSVTTTSTQAGGIVGYVNGGTIENCVNYAEINSTSNTAGGIAGAAYSATITGCSNYGTVTSTGSYIGGIVGSPSSSSAVQTKIIDCYNAGDVTGGNQYIGGIAGNASSNTITGCCNIGKITGGSYVGGIAGAFVGSTSSWGGGKGNMASCYNTGAVSGTDYVGGIMGRIGTSDVKDCYTTGAVTAAEDKTNVGAFVGQVYDTSISYEDIYYLEGAAATDVGAAVKTADEMKSAEFLTALGEGYKEDAGLINGGYPILTWQVVAEEPEVYDVTIPTGDGYTVSGEKTATEGESYTFTVEVAEDYDAANIVVKVNGETVSAVEGKYTVENVSGDLVITVEGIAEKAEVYEVTIPTGDGYTVTGDTTVIEGASYTFHVDVDYRYKEGEAFAVKVNGETVTGTEGKYTVENVTTDLTITVEGVEKIVLEPVTAYFSVSHDANFVAGVATGEVMALKEMKVPYFDLGLYGLENFYFSSETYGSDGTGKPSSTLQPGTKEYAYGKITMLHLFIYATEVYYCGVPESEAGKGYLYEEGILGTETLMISGSTGSSFMESFWNMDLNLNYYLNYEYPLASAGWGATSDQILLEDGEIVTLGHFTSWDFFNDPTSVFNYIKAGDSTVTTSAAQYDKVEMTVYHAGSNMSGDYGTAHTAVTSNPEVFYASVKDLEDGDVTNWTSLGNADASGKITVDTKEMKPGQYIIAVAGQYGSVNTDSICSTPGGILLNVTEHTEHNYETVVTAPTCTEQGYTTHTCVCGDSKVDSYVDALGHTEVIDAAVAATCTKSGLTEGKHCSVCNEVLVAQKTTDTLDHKYVDGVCTACGTDDPDYVKPAEPAQPADVIVSISDGNGKVVMALQTVTVKDLDSDGVLTVNEALYAAHEAGYEGGAAEGYATTQTAYGLSLSKLWGVDNGGLYGYWLNHASCWSMTDEVEAGDYLVAFIYQDLATWSDSYSKLDAMAYTAEDGTVKIALEKAGYDASYNTVFSAMPGAAITLYSSDMKKMAETAYTVTDNGDGSYTVSIKEAGNFYLIASGNDSTILVPAVATVKVEDPAHVHTYDKVVTDATCTEGGYTTYTCACGDSYVSDKIDALGHTEVTDKAVAATCTATGLTEGKHCFVCKEVLVKQEVTDALGHTEVTDKAVAPTCTKTGLTEGKHCFVCKQILLKQETVPATGSHVYADAEAVACAQCGVIITVDMHRLYNPNTGEHFYTGSLEERDALVEAGWNYEGIAWQAPVHGGLPIYRVFNPNNGDHHYTGSQEEVDTLVDAGWNYEDVAWNTPLTGIGVHRLYNPNAQCGSHHYTTSEEEVAMLVEAGWQYEDVAWNGVGEED